MNKQQENIIKLKSLEEYSKFHTVKETEDYIRQIFPEDEFKTLEENISDYHSKTIFISAGGYFSINIINGTDILIKSVLDNKGVYLFCENHFEDIQLQKFLEDSNKSVNLENIVKYFKKDNDLETAYLYNCLPDDIKNNREIIYSVLNIIDIYAAIKHSLLDEKSLNTTEIFLRTINEFDFPDNEIYKEEFKKVFLSHEDNLNYVFELISCCNEMIHMVERKDDIHHKVKQETKKIESDIKKIKSDIELYERKEQSLKKELNIVNEKMDQIQTKINYFNDGLLDLKSEKYNFITQFTQKSKDLQQIQLLNKKIKEFKEEKDNCISQQEEKKSLLSFYKQQVSDKSNNLGELYDKLRRADIIYIDNVIMTQNGDEPGFYNYKDVLKKAVINYECFKQEKEKWEDFIKDVNSYNIESTHFQKVSDIKLNIETSVNGQYDEYEDEEDMEME